MTDFEKIYKSYFSDVFLYANSLSRDVHLAEEITSETFFKALEKIDSFRGDCDIRVWLCQIAKNCFLSHLRRQKKLDFDSDKKEIEDNANLEEIVADKSLALSLHQLLHELDEPYKEVFTLRVFGELSFKDIGSIFQKSENWACVCYHRAKAKLAKQLKDTEEIK